MVCNSTLVSPDFMDMDKCAGATYFNGSSVREGNQIDASDVITAKADLLVRNKNGAFGGEPI